MPRRQLSESPRNKLDRLRNSRDSLHALVALSDSRIAEFARQTTSLQSELDALDRQQTMPDMEEVGRISKELAKVAAAAQAEREASAPLRADLDAAERVIQKLADFERTYGVPTGDARKTVRVKILRGTLVQGGKSFTAGAVVELTEPEALSLQQKGMVEPC